MLASVLKKINSEDEMILFAEEMCNTINAGVVLVLNGNLGAGKTFFVKAFCSFLGINNVTSPTFSLVNEFLGDKRVVHFDFYRINAVNELYDIGFDEYLSDSEAVVFIEWGELFPAILPKQRIDIQININDDESRDIEVRYYE